MRILISLLLLPVSAFAEAIHEELFVFDAAGSTHGHVHGSSIVETPSGELIAVWYENGPVLPDPYYNEDQDKSSNVRIGGARKAAGAAAWAKPFVMADTFGVSDNNAALAVDKEERLWLVYPTLLGVPEWTWGSGLLRYHVAESYQGEGAPQWSNSNILVVQPQGLEAVLENSALKWAERMKAAGQEAQAGRVHDMLDRLKSRLSDSSNPLLQRLGWMPRAHPLVRRDGAVVLPLSNENFNIAMMAITEDGGQTWTFSNPVPEVGLTQPTLAEFSDGHIAAFFRNSSPERRIKRSDSTDGGMTWGEVTLTELVHPGAGIEALALENDHLVMIYNDVEESPREKLAVSISDDRGKTWKWTRHLENTPGERFDYPSIIQAKDGSLHATYSYHLKTIKHVRFNEEWVQAGE